MQYLPKAKKEKFEEELNSIRKERLNNRRLDRVRERKIKYQREKEEAQRKAEEERLRKGIFVRLLNFLMCFKQFKYTCDFLALYIYFNMFKNGSL